MMMIEFTKPVKNVSPCGALVYAAMPALYPTIGLYSSHKLDGADAVRELVNMLKACSVRSSGVEWRVIGDSTNNSPELTDGGWLVIDVYAKPTVLTDFFATRFRLRRKKYCVVECDVIALGNGESS